MCDAAPYGKPGAKHSLSLGLFSIKTNRSVPLVHYNLTYNLRLLGKEFTVVN